jgi:PhnB protein
MPVQPIPAGYHTATPYLIVNDPVAAIDFYKRAFGATELLRLLFPDGKIAHAEIKIGDSPIMLGGEYPDMGYLSPTSIGGSGTSIMLYVEDVDSQFRQAIEAGATELRPVQDQFYGDRTGALKDPFGHVWSVATHKEDLTQTEVEERFAKVCQ